MVHVNTADPLERIESKHGVLGGKPVIKGTRLSVERIVDLLAAGETIPELLSDYPHITEDDLEACLAFARRRRRFAVRLIRIDQLARDQLSAVC
jgi:uncharacterized protein (DUF433 family)